MNNMMKIPSLFFGKSAKVFCLCGLVALLVYSPALWFSYIKKITTPMVRASSQLENFSPNGLFDLKQPGWHAARPANYPQTILIDFRNVHDIRSIGFLPQDDNTLRGPRAIRIETSNDGEYWSPIAGSDDICLANTPRGWHEIALESTTETRFLRVLIFSNCGDPEFLTLRGLKIE